MIDIDTIGACQVVLDLSVFSLVNTAINIFQVYLLYKIIRIIREWE